MNPARFQSSNRPPVWRVSENAAGKAGVHEVPGSGGIENAVPSHATPPVDRVNPANPSLPRPTTVPLTVQQILRCPHCRSGLRRLDGHWGCINPACDTHFPVVEGVPVLIDDHKSLFRREDFVARKSTTFDLDRGWIRRLDHCLPNLGRNLASQRNYRAMAQCLLSEVATPAVLVLGGSILGSGMECLTLEPRLRLVETDVSFGPRTQLICDAHQLPFETQSFDGVIAQAVLQYVLEPAQCIREIERVLKPRGLVYVESAFMQQVVHGRYDFCRFTHLGLRRLFRDFVELDSGPVGGPGMALAWSGQFFLLSLAQGRWTRRALYAFARLALFWLKFFDPALKNKPGTYDAASGFYFLGRKGDRVLPDRELVTLYRGAQ